MEQKEYKVILVDPPWSFRDKQMAGHRGACCKYKTMSNRQLYALREYVVGVADEDCFLFVWAPTTHTIEAKKLISAWGFQPKQQRAFTWIKTTVNNKLFWGMGTLTRSNPEDVWCGVRGKPKRASASVHSVIMAQRREHSRKPDEIYTRIENLCGPGPKLEMFARQRWPGWDAHGDEINLYRTLTRYEDQAQP
jgi:site-specific DNA-methyltransferase (adenine-specific)